MKHRTRAVAPAVRASRRAARRLAARFFLALATVAAGTLPAHAMGGDRLPSAQDRSGPLDATAPQAARAGRSASNARLGNDATGGRRGGVATAGGSFAVSAAAASAPDAQVAAQRRSLPETRTWALFGVGLLAVLMMTRRQRQHD